MQPVSHTRASCIPTLARGPSYPAVTCPTTEPAASQLRVPVVPHPKASHILAPDNEPLLYLGPSYPLQSQPYFRTR